MLAQEQLEQRRNDLQGEILDLFSIQEYALLHKQNQIQETNRLINDNITEAKNTTQTGDIGKLKPICDSLKEVNDKTRTMLSDIDIGEDYLVFDPNKGFKEFIECLGTLGQPYYRGFLPTMIRLQGVEVTVGHKTELTVEVYNYHGDRVTVTPSSFSVQITDPENREIHTELCTTGTDCIVTFTPKISGLYQVSGFFLGQELIGEQTQISVSSNNPVLKFGKKGNGKGTFNFPMGIAIDNDGVLYVTDRGNRLIQKFSVKGEFLSQFSVNGHNKDCTTLDLALDLKNGLIYCIDIVFKNNAYSAGNNMLVFNLDGKLQHIHNFTGVSYPSSIAINSHGDIFISDLIQKCLFKVNKEGNALWRMGTFKNQSHITITNDDRLIVSDYKDSCIYIFDPDAAIRHKFGTSGTENGQLKRPWGAAADQENILVADSGNNRVQVFSSEGIFLSMIESSDDQLNSPWGLAVTKDGYVYVVDHGNHCIKKYKYKYVTRTI